MIADKQTQNPATELALLATEIDEAVSGSFEGGDSSAASALNGGGAWEYHFEADERWGFVAAGPDEMVETSYPGWGTITVEPDHCAVFYDGNLAGIVSPYGGRIGGYAAAARNEQVDELEGAMLDAFRAEYDLLMNESDWKPPLASRSEG